jgi:hypothetical protein
VYPNPQDALPLPPRPNVEQYRKRARELAKLCRSGNDTIQRWAARWVEKLLEHQPNVPELVRRDSESRTRQIAEYARHQLTRANCALSQAQFVVARVHGFARWPKLIRHIEGLSGVDFALSAFERAADAIAGGDVAVLERLLAAQPGLVHARSDREHHATLLHYVSANGVENYRQRSLDRGARMQAGIVRSCLMNGCPEAAVHMAARGASVDLEEAAAWADWTWSPDISSRPAKCRLATPRPRSSWLPGMTSATS